MKNFLWASVALSSVLLAAGCEQTRASKQEVGHGSGTGQSAEQRQAAHQPATEPATTGTPSDGEQPDDPGMTAAHDKTLKQEQPSGDESSQAAPNEGDAEPPQ